MKSVSTPPDNPIVVVDFESRHRDAFRMLNEAWITKYFSLEPSDLEMLDAPEDRIVAKGGAILVAVRGDEVLGVCALLAKGDATYELAKMAVADEAQGQGIGTLLGRIAIAKARSLGASRVILESNTRLEPAMALYAKLGFKKIDGGPSPYCRCNIQMELTL
jgi:GNAT superfamily N-acetyltransferase